MKGDQEIRPIYNKSAQVVLLQSNYSPKLGYFVFPVQLDSTPSHNNQIILPSGIFVIGIDTWVSRFTLIFQTVQTGQEE